MINFFGRHSNWRKRIAVALIAGVALLASAYAVRPFLSHGKRQLKGQIAQIQPHLVLFAAPAATIAQVRPVMPLAFVIAAPAAALVQPALIAREHIRPPPSA